MGEELEQRDGSPGRELLVPISSVSIGGVVRLDAARVIVGSLVNNLLEVGDGGPFFA